MTREEFKVRVKTPFTNDEYEIIETVYSFHPSINEVKGKDQIAELYNNFGMRVILDMLPTAEKAKELENELKKKKIEIDNLRRELNQLIDGR